MQDFRNHSRQKWHQHYQNQAEWTQHIRQFIFNTIQISSEACILEIGSGTGVLLELISKQGNFRLFGVDLDYPSLSYCQSLYNGFLLTQASGEHLPFPPSCFDLSFCHYLLMWNNHPEDILCEMIRATRPEGWVLALAEPDYQARIDYPPPLDNLGSLQNQSLQAQGADITIGRKLRSLFHQVGLQNITVGVLAAQWDQLNKINETEWMMTRGDLEGHLPENVLIHYFQEDQAAQLTGERILYIPTFYGMGQVQKISF